MVSRSRFVVLGTIASVLMALGCKTEAPTTTNIEDNGKITRSTKAPTRGGAFKGSVNFGGSLSADKARVTLVDEKLQVITFAGSAKPDSAGKFAFKQTPTRVYFVLAEGDKAKMLGAVLPVESKDPNDEPVITINGASTLAVAGILGAFDPSRGGQFQLEDLPVDLFTKLVDAIAVTNPQLDLTRDPSEHGAQFTDLYKANAGVKTAYDALFGELKSRFEKRNPGLPVPVQSLPTSTSSLDPNVTASSNSGLASIAPSPLPSPLPSPSPSLSPSPGASASAPASVAPSVSVAPRVFDPLKHTMTTVTGNTEEGLPIEVDGTFNHHPTKVLIANPGPELMVIPDGNRLLVAESVTEKFGIADLSVLLKANPGDAAVAVNGVAGVAADGQVLYMVGIVSGTPSLIKVTATISGGPLPTYTASHLALTGTDLPTGFQGQAFHAGSLYVASPAQHRIYKIDVANAATTRYSGADQATSAFAAEIDVAAATYNAPQGLVALGGSIYVAEEEFHRILKINPTTNKVDVVTGKVAFGLVSGTLADARFQRPNGLYLDNQGKFLVADRTNGAVRVVFPDADPNKAEVLNYVTPDETGLADPAKFLPFFRGVGKCGANTFAIDTQGKLRKLVPKP